MKKLLILLFSFFLLGSPSVFAEDSYESLKWQDGPKTQKILDLATIFLPENYVALDLEETDKYLELSQNMATGNRNFLDQMIALGMDILVLIRLAM